MTWIEDQEIAERNPAIRAQVQAIYRHEISAAEARAYSRAREDRLERFTVKPPTEPIRWEALSFQASRVINDGEINELDYRMVVQNDFIHKCGLHEADRAARENILSELMAKGYLKEETIENPRHNDICRRFSIIVGKIKKK